MTLQRYLTRLIWLCVGPLLLLALVLALLRVHEVQTDSEREAENLARQVAQAVDLSLQARLAALRTLAASPLVAQRERWPEFYQEAQGFAQVFGSPVALAEPGPRLQLHTEVPLGAALPADPAGSGWRAVAMALAKGEPVVGDLERQAPLTDGPVVGVAVPVLRDQRAVLALASPVAASRFESLLRTAALPPGWTLALRDSRGEMVARLGPLQSDFGARVAPAQSHITALESAPWNVVLEVPREAHAAPLQSAAVLLLAVLLVTVAVALLGGQWASRRLARAVGSLARVPSSSPPQAASALEIAEVVQARRLLDEAFSAREHAESGRLASERERLERASFELQISQARLRAIFDSVADAVITTDDAHAIVMANPAAARMLRCPLPQLMGAPMTRFLPERHRERYLADTRALAGVDALTEAPERRSGVQGQRSDGSRFPLDLALSHLNIDGQRLFTVVLRDTTERQRAEAALRHHLAELQQARAEVERSHASLQRLVAAQDSVQERERTRIARELHDELQQTLAAIQMDAAAGAALLHEAPRQALPLLMRIDELAGASIAATRRIVNDLRPQMLEELGLVTALEALASQFAERTGVACTVRAVGAFADGEQVPPTVATCLYRVAQESLNNVGKHAGATGVRIVLLVTPEGRHSLRISDNGRGMSDADRAKPEAFGLLGMQQRVRALGGTLRLKRAKGGGVTVEVVLPSGTAAGT